MFPFTCLPDTPRKRTNAIPSFTFYTVSPILMIGGSGLVQCWLPTSALRACKAFYQCSCCCRQGVRCGRARNDYRHAQRVYGVRGQHVFEFGDDRRSGKGISRRIWLPMWIATIARFPNVKAAALPGHSMGGYGTVRLSFKSPEVFSSVYAMSPCCMAADINPRLEMGDADRCDQDSAGCGEGECRGQGYARFSGSLVSKFQESAVLF